MVVADGASAAAAAAGRSAAVAEAADYTSEAEPLSCQASASATGAAVAFVAPLAAFAAVQSMAVWVAGWAAVDQWELADKLARLQAQPRARVQRLAQWALQPVQA